MGDTTPATFSASSAFKHFLRWQKITRRRRNGRPSLPEVLDGAEQLLIHATESGIVVEQEISRQIIAAKRDQMVWASAESVQVIEAIATLAAKVRPVTAQTLASARDIAHQEGIYSRLAILLVILIIPLSVASLIASGLSTSISAEITAANDLTVALHTQLDSPGPATESVLLTEPAPVGSLSEAAQFASTIRTVKDHATQLNYFLFRWQEVPDFTPDHRKPGAQSPYELDATQPISVAFLRDETNAKTRIYQEVRHFAKQVQDKVTLWYGALATYVLPILYAALGVCAYLLRLFQQELRTGSCLNRYDISARFFVAIIGGFIVGQFSSFNVTGASLPPLAIAFLVGYAADVFFSFLEGLIATVRKPVASENTKSAADGARGAASM